MRVCLQRVARAAVTVEGETVGSIERGLLLLVGIAQGDTERDLFYLADKVASLRVFNDAQGKMNLSLADVGGSLLIVSQFTLLGDCRKGRRPSFVEAAPPGLARSLYEQFVDALRQRGCSVATGQFQAHMQIELVNDGPVTLVLES